MVCFRALESLEALALHVHGFRRRSALATAPAASAARTARSVWLPRRPTLCTLRGGFPDICCWWLGLAGGAAGSYSSAAAARWMVLQSWSAYLGWELIILGERRRRAGAGPPSGAPSGESCWWSCWMAAGQEPHVLPGGEERERKRGLRVAQPPPPPPHLHPHPRQVAALTACFCGWLLLRLVFVLWSLSRPGSR